MFQWIAYINVYWGEGGRGKGEGGSFSKNFYKLKKYSYLNAPRFESNF